MLQYQHCLGFHVASAQLKALTCTQDAAQWVLDQDDLLELQSGWQARQQQQEQAAVVTAKQDKENRKRLLSKYDLQAVHTGPTILADARHHSSSKATTKVSWAIVQHSCQSAEW